ncbi:MAG: hypothetical protein GX605_04590 [Chloroflexi bacterium]|nr:hypothetical protein [Chloroflexota bacterium]
MDHHRTMWVKPWTMVTLPTFPSPAPREALSVLHALLLHGGLSPALLSRLLPSSPMAALRSLHRWEAAGLVEQTEGRWCVRALGYPPARQALEREGFLVDAL